MGNSREKVERCGSSVGRDCAVAGATLGAEAMGLDSELPWGEASSSAGGNGTAPNGTNPDDEGGGLAELLEDKETWQFIAWVSAGIACTVSGTYRAASLVVAGSSSECLVQESCLTHCGENSWSLQPSLRQALGHERYRQDWNSAWPAVC